MVSLPAVLSCSSDEGEMEREVARRSRSSRRRLSFLPVELVSIVRPSRLMMKTYDSSSEQSCSESASSQPGPRSLSSPHQDWSTPGTLSSARRTLSMEPSTRAYCTRARRASGELGRAGRCSRCSSQRSLLRASGDIRVRRCEEQMSMDLIKWM